MNRFLAIFALAALAVAEPEADPQFLLGSPLVHSIATPYTYIKPAMVEMKKMDEKKVEAVEYKKIEEPMMKYTTSVNPMVYNSMAYHPYAMNWAARTISFPYATTHSMVRIAKREAEPQMFYNTALPYAANWAAHPYAANWAYPYMMPATVKTLDNAREKVETPEYAGKGKYVAENAGAIHIAKREAEPQMFYHATMPYAANWASYPYAANWAAHPYAANWAAFPYMMPATVKTLDNAREKVETPEYAGKGKYVAESAGAIHIAKREAEPQMFYNNALPYAASWPMTYNTIAARYPYTTPFAYRSAYNFPYYL